VEPRILVGADHDGLHGVRLAVKDNIPVEGFRFTAGHTLFLNRRAPYTAPAVQLLLDAGAVIVGTTCSDAGGFGVPTPRVLNPIARDLIVGGSTGGAATAVAAVRALSMAGRLPDSRIDYARYVLGETGRQLSELFAQVDVLLLPTLPARPPGVPDRTVKLGELELPVLRAMIYETSLLNMYGAPVVTLPDLPSTGGLAESVPLSFQIAGPHRSTYPA
jgi:Asp-tRNA(Asn)/Glu-tRNA(Gln) amidotransferase A subunit family amidase